MSGVAIVFTLIKILIVVMFVLNVGGVLTWVERRQMSMIQDRIGPNRAVVFVPASLVKAALAGGGVLLGLAAAGYAFGGGHEDLAKVGAGFLLLHIGVLVSWLGGLVVRARARQDGATSGFEGALASMDDPRPIFHLGMVAHLLLAIGFFSLRSAEGVGMAVLVAGAAYSAFALGAFGVWASTKVTGEKVGLRLAGLLHPAADGIKFVMKEHFVPPNADKLLFNLGPLIALFPALVVFAVIPFGDTVCVRYPTNLPWYQALFQMKWAGSVPASGVCAEQALSLQVADLNVGILYIFALAGTGIVGAAIAGWSSDNKFSLLGGLRASSQMVSYEVAMGLSLVGAFMIYGTLRLDDMVRWQNQHTWGIFVQPLAFFLFFTAAIAEQKRTPFDAPEGESEIVAGYFLEYSGMRFSMFMLGEYIEIVTSSAMLVTIFLGGWSLPFLARDGITLAIGDTVLFHQQMSHLAVIGLGILAFFGKVLFLCWFQIFIRWTVPRFRYDQIMKLGWKMLLPAALVNMMVTGLVMLAIDSAGVGVSNALGIAAQVTQLLIVVGGLVGFVSLVSFILKPVDRKRTVVSSAARYAAAQGGVKSAPMQA